LAAKRICGRKKNGKKENEGGRFGKSGGVRKKWEKQRKERL